MDYYRLPIGAINNRPLIFLCGPYCNDTDYKDRRNILRKYLSKVKFSIEVNNENVEISFFPLIIDNLFNEEKLSCLDINIVEEIVANSSYYIFVFLDTISTALELGLFSNSYVNNHIVALLPKDYLYFRPSIGTFAKDSLIKAENIDYLEYSAKRFNQYTKDKGKVFVKENLISFKTRKLPKEISGFIDSKLNRTEVSPYLISFEFTTDFSNKDKFIYQINEDKLIVYINIKQLFYIINQYSTIRVKDVVFEFFKQNECLNNKSMLVELYKVENRLKGFELRTQFNADVNDVISYVKEFIDSVKGKEMGNVKTMHLKYKPLWKSNYYFKEITFNDLVNLDLTLINLGSPRKILSKAVGSKHITINGKIRKIEYYQPNSEGYKLRKFHDELRDKLIELIPLSNSCYGYCVGKSAKMAVSQHMGSKYFLKIDIKDFFNSISKAKMNKVIRILLSKDSARNYDKYFSENESISFKSIITNWKTLSDTLNLCFINNRLPLGFSISPLLSNLFLLMFDKRLEYKFEDIVYTRYADDILVSSNNQIAILRVRDYIKDELKMLGLETNIHKEKLLCLDNPNKHIKFLGINLVSTEKGTRLTLGKRKIKSLCRELSDFLEGNSTLSKEQMIGKIEYVKYISLDDYNYLLYLYELKNKKKFDYLNFKKNYLRIYF